jgi:trehalose-phosphatase
VVRAVSEVRFLRRVPPALDHCADIAAWAAGRRLAVFLDYDGTLTPIVDRPEKAHLAGDVRAMVEALAGRCPVAIVSGRDRRDVEARVRIEGVCYAGSHGFDMAWAGQEKTLPVAAEAIRDVDDAERELRQVLSGVEGVVLERKRFSLAVHYRLVAPRDVPRVRDAVERAASRPRLRRRPGKKVVELEPAVDWDKGRAVLWFVEALGLERQATRVLYIGDDETDEDAFAVLGVGGIGLRVGGELTTTRADYCLRSQDEVRTFLGWLVRQLDGTADAPGPAGGALRRHCGGS